jgi:hypothetical protein
MSMWKRQVGWEWSPENLKIKILKTQYLNDPKNSTNKLLNIMNTSSKKQDTKSMYTKSMYNNQ